MAKRPVIVWGAGRIGRGFAAEVFSTPDYDVTLADIDAKLIGRLRENGCFTVFEASDTGIRPVRVEGYRALHTDERAALLDQAMGSMPIIAVAVHAPALRGLAAMLAPILRARAQEKPAEPMDIMLLVNMVHPGPMFRGFLADGLKGDRAALNYLRDKVGIVETVVLRISPMAPEHLTKLDPCAIFTNNYPHLTADRLAFRGPAPEAPMLRLIENLAAEEVRKIYTINMAHATCAYVGLPLGFTYTAEMARDPAMSTLLREALSESSIGLSGRYGFTQGEMADFCDQIMRMIENRHMPDDLQRLGADSLRKLSYTDRLVGPARLSIEHGGEPVTLAGVIRKGFDYQNDDEGTKRVRSIYLEKGLEGALKEVCGLSPDEPLYEMILRA